MKYSSTLWIAAAITLSFSAPASAKQESAKQTDPKMRQQMAEMHENMAKCLRSNKSMSECHDQMMSNGRMGDMCAGMMEGKGGHMGGMMGSDRMGNMGTAGEGSKKKD